MRQFGRRPYKHINRSGRPPGRRDEKAGRFGGKISPISRKLLTAVVDCVFILYTFTQNHCLVSGSVDFPNSWGTVAKLTAS